MRKIFLRKAFIPTHQENRMKNEGDLESARQQFLEKDFSNLHYLLRNRYSWMNKYLYGREFVVELGAGAGFSRFFITNEKLILTDVDCHQWVDRQVDAMNLPFEDNSVDCFICSHMIHHIYNPKKFFHGVQAKLKDGGLLLIQEINTSLLMRTILKLMCHEGWSYDVNVFDEDEVANNPDDPFSANCAIPELLFTDDGTFENEFPGLKIIRNSLCECFTFPLSGGVISKHKTIELPFAVLKAINQLDRACIAVIPSVFAMGRSVVIRKDIEETA